MKRAAGVALAGVALTLVAFMFDAALLFVPGIAFTVLSAVVAVWVWTCAQGASIERHMHAERVIEGQPLQATVEVRRGILGLPGAEVLDPLAGAPISLSEPLSRIRGRRTANVRVVARFARRGLRRLEPPALIVRDPLELATIVRVGAGPAQEVLVLPHTEPVRWGENARGERSDRAGAAVAGEPLAAVDVDGLRPYRQGTPASRIHWPAVARGAGLLERRLQADADVRPLVVLDARGAGPPEHLDAAVRATASLALELARRGACGLLLPGERRAITIDSDLATWPGAHARLALVEGGPRTRPPILSGGIRLGPVFYVAAQQLERLPVTLSGAGRGAGVLVLPTELSAGMPGTPSFEVAGCHGFVVSKRGARSQERGRVSRSPQRVS